MADIDKGKLAQVIDEIEDEHGEGSIYYLGDDPDLQIERTKTNLDDFDWVMGGGIPQGRIIELYGKENAGKTSLVHYMQSLYDLALHIDMEGSFVAERAYTFGNEKGQLIIRKPSWGEQAIELIIKAAEAGCPLIAIDSVPALIPKEQVQEENIEKDRVASVAGLLSRWMFKIAKAAEESGVTVIFLNQIRDNFGGGPWNPYTTPGGHALRHFASLRIQVKRKKWIKVSSDAEGQMIRLRTYKSKVCAPYRDCEIPLIFEKGFINGGEKDAKEIIYEIRRKRRKEQKENNE